MKFEAAVDCFLQIELTNSLQRAHPILSYHFIKKRTRNTPEFRIRIQMLWVDPDLALKGQTNKILYVQEVVTHLIQ